MRRLLLCVCAVLMAGTAYASTWTPSGGSPGAVPSNQNFTGCKVEKDWMDGVPHPLKYVIETTNPPGTLVLDGDTLPAGAKENLDNATNQNDSNNTVHTDGNGNVDRVRTG
jgi:hypothetical protein